MLFDIGSVFSFVPVKFHTNIVNTYCQYVNDKIGLRSGRRTILALSRERRESPLE
jgi:hypothetical protein